MPAIHINAIHESNAVGPVGLASDVESLRKTITDLQATPGVLTPEDQALLNAAEVKVNALSVKTGVSVKTSGSNYPFSGSYPYSGSNYPYSDSYHSGPFPAHGSNHWNLSSTSFGQPVLA